MPSFNIGGSSPDWSGYVNGPARTNALGTFTYETGCSSYKCETDTFSVYNHFSLQLNTNTYYTTLNGHQVEYWMQFIYYDNPIYQQGYMGIQYWIYFYPNACSTITIGGGGWTGNTGSCSKNSPTWGVAYLTVDKLTQASLAGILSSSSDTIKYYQGSQVWAQSNPDWLNFYSGNWNTAEFNIFGPAGGGANFVPGVTLNVQNNFGNTGSGQFETCNKITFTGEWNNLNLGSCGGNGNYVTFAESD